MIKRIPKVCFFLTIGLGALARLLFVAPGVAAQNAPIEITLSGMPVAETYPLLAIIDQNRLSDVCGSVKFAPWNTPDQMRALVATGQADFVVLPTNVAARLHTNGIKVRLLFVSLSSSLWILGTEGENLTLEDLKGHEIAMPFRGDMPEMVFLRLAAGLGLNPQRDVRLRYVATPMDGVQLLLLGRVKYAFLAEPAVSAALQRVQADPSGVRPAAVHRAVDVQAEWRRAFPQGPGLLLGGIAAAPRVCGNAVVVGRFMQEYRQALDWCRQHPRETGMLVQRYFPYVSAEAVAAGMQAMPHRVAVASEVEQQLARFLAMTMVEQDSAKAVAASIKDLCWREE